MRDRTSWTRIGAPLLVGALLAACGSEVTFSPEFDASLNINLAAMTRTGSGLYYQDLAAGAGNAAKAGDRATVGYSGWLPNGQLFDSGTFPFTVGVGQVVAGFDEGVLGMKVGGKRKLVIPPSSAMETREGGAFRPIPRWFSRWSSRRSASGGPLRPPYSFGSVTPTCFMYFPFRSA